MPKNLIREALVTKLEVAEKSGVAKKAYDKCRDNFILFHVINYIAYSEAKDAFCAIEDAGLMRQDIKRHTNACEKEWSRYYNDLRSRLQNKAWFFLNDMFMSAHNGIEHDLTLARYTTANILLRHKRKRSEILSLLAVPLFLLGLYSYLWKSFFATYRRVCGLDFSGEYTWARIDQFFFHLKEIEKIVDKVNGSKGVDMSKEPAYVSAMSIIESKLTGKSGNLLDDAAKVALGYGGYLDENGNIKETEQ